MDSPFALNVRQTIDRENRRLRAVMFTDLAGFTALIEADERRGLNARDRNMRSIDTHHAAFRGTIVKRLVDGTLSTFPSSLDAVRAGNSNQRELAATLPVRVGIHVGEVIVEDNNVIGDAVNIASRIESFSVPDGVLMSGSACEQVRNQGEVEVVALGRFQFKNVGRPYEIFAVSSEGVIVPEPGMLQGKGEQSAGLPSNLPNLIAPLVGRVGDRGEEAGIHSAIAWTHLQDGDSVSASLLLRVRSGAHRHRQHSRVRTPTDRTRGGRRVRAAL
jgi:class 3 adenylate cyclase